MSKTNGTKVTFETSDPKSPEWRKAWDRFITRRLEPIDDDFIYKILKEVHHRGWRAGVQSVRREGPPPGSPSHYTVDERRAWEHGAVAGRQAARAYVHAEGIEPGKLH